MGREKGSHKVVLLGEGFKRVLATGTMSGSDHFLPIWFMSVRPQLGTAEK